MRRVWVVWLIVGCGRIGFDATAIVGRWEHVSTSGDATCAITQGGELWCWGRGTSAHLGNGPVHVQPPARVGTFDDWQQVSVGRVVTCGLRSDRSLWCWGKNQNGAIPGTPADNVVETPARIGSGTWQSVAAAADHVCAIDSAGALSCWGEGSLGVLGNGQLTSRSQPTPVSPVGTNEWIAISASILNRCGIQTDNTLWCWGQNAAGQVGDNTNTLRNAPVQVGAGTSWVAIANGTDQTCALDGTNQLWCWGFNGFGQLGDGMPRFGSQLVPKRATVVPALTSLAVGRVHVCGTAATGDVSCWGNGERGQFGQVVPQSASPVPVASAAVEVVAAGDVTCVIDAGARLSCTGANSYGQLGSASGAVTSPVQSDTRSDWTQVFASIDHACGISANNRLSCWGLNHNGELAYGRPEDASAVTDTGNDATTIALGTNTTLALQPDSSVWLSGSDPDLVSRHLSPIVFAPVGSTKAIAYGDRHGCRIRSDDTLVCFGSNSVGQLGNGMTTDTQNAVVPGTWRTIAAAYNSTCAVTVMGALLCWGANTSGKLGIGNTTTQTMPQQVSIQSANGPVDEIASGLAFTCARTSGGEIWCWGAGNHGQLGNGTTAGSTTPVRMGSATSWTKISAGHEHACALQTDNTLWCWGRGDEGQVGSALMDQAMPVQIGGAEWRDVAAGTQFTCAVKLDGTRWCFGSNAEGALGTGLGWRAQFAVIP
jgi:alpha-tubulin suppressor-like RCC1 family protein